MNNAQRIDDFLKYYAKIGIQNPNYMFNTDRSTKQIYSELIRRDVKEEDKKVYLAESFGSPFPDSYNYDKLAEQQYKKSPFYNWIEYYKNNDKIDVFRTEDWPYFCQFVSKDKTARKSNEHIKIYIPLDREHIEKGAKLIFNFLSDNNISHVSKIGKEIRFDDIVVRLIKEEDAKKLLNFVKNQPYLQEGLIKPNPFAFQEGNIAMACDGDKSYNYTVAQIIDLYLDDCKKKNRLSNVSYQDYYHFVATNYNHEFIDKNSHLLENKLKIEDEKSKKNYQYIIALMLKSQSSDFSLDDYMRHYHQSVNSKEKKVVVKENNNSNQLLLKAIQTMTEKYGIEVAYKNITSYLITGNSGYLTRSNNLREEVENSSMREEIRKTLKEQEMNLKQYVEKLTVNSISINEDLLREAILVSGERFNNNGIGQVKAYIYTGKETLLTSNHNLRDRVTKSNLRETVLEKLQKENISFEELVERMMPNYTTKAVKK